MNPVISGLTRIEPQTGNGVPLYAKSTFIALSIPAPIPPHVTEFLQRRRNCPEAVQPRLEVLDDLFGQFIRFGQVIQIGEALVFQPENIQAGFVARNDLIIAELAPAAFGVLCSCQVSLRLWRLAGCSRR